MVVAPARFNCLGKYRRDAIELTLDMNIYCWRRRLKYHVQNDNDVSRTQFQRSVHGARGAVTSKALQSLTGDGFAKRTVDKSGNGAVTRNRLASQVNYIIWISVAVPYFHDELLR